MRRFLPTLVLVLHAGSLGGGADAAAEKSGAERIMAAGRQESRAEEHLDHLVNRIGPRLTGSDGLQVAAEWAVDVFRGFGIENARLERWGEFPVGFNRGPWSGSMVEPEAMPLSFGTDAWTAGTRGVVRAPAVLAPGRVEEIADLGNEIRGKWVLEPAPPPGRTMGQDHQFRQALERACRRERAAGIIRPARGDLIHTVGGDSRIRWGALPELPSITLLGGQFEGIAARLRDGRAVVLEFDIRNHFKKGPIPLYNVVADIPGREFPDEYVIVGGHLDSFDGATGSTDNGTGVATTLEAARLLMKSGVRPRRTIRFMLWSGEEQGRLGSRAYVRAHPELAGKVSAVLVHDGGTNYLSGLGVTRAMRRDVEEALAPAIGLDAAMPFAIREVDALRPCGSDHDSFLAAGVPGFFWDQAGRASYPRTHHTQHDTFDAAIPEYQRHSALVVALGAFGIADLERLLPRGPVPAGAAIPGSAPSLARARR